MDAGGKEFKPGKNDVVFVYATVIDADGTTIPENKRVIKFVIEGYAEFIGRPNSFQEIPGPEKQTT